MSRRARVLVVLLAGSLVLASAVAGANASVLLYLLPALALAAPLILRRYPGERRLLALIAGRSRPRRGLGARAPSSARRGTLVPRGGLLIACSLAVRPPPRPLIVS
ncbi:MAG TPA: hypothetical protein VNC12_03205 [Solirubrobacteraceae bacterium]|nr:hypothetical protein [Solirubrobacteraceae bacterium]